MGTMSLGVKCIGLIMERHITILIHISIFLNTTLIKVAGLGKVVQYCKKIFYSVHN